MGNGKEKNGEFHFAYVDFEMSWPIPLKMASKQLDIEVRSSEERLGYGHRSQNHYHVDAAIAIRKDGPTRSRG